MEHSDVLCRKSYWPGGAGHGRCFQYTFDSYLGQISVTEAILIHCGVVVPHNSQHEVLSNFYWTLLSSLPTIFCFKGIAKKIPLFKNFALRQVKKETDMGRSRSWSRSWSRSRFFQAGVGVGAGVAEIWSTPQPCVQTTYNLQSFMKKVTGDLIIVPAICEVCKQHRPLQVSD